MYERQSETLLEYQFLVGMNHCLDIVCLAHKVEVSSDYFW